MPVLYFYRLPISVAASVFREVVWRTIQNISENPQIIRKPLIVLDISVDASPGYEHPGHGYIELLTENMADLLLAKLETEPITFQSQEVVFTREKPNGLENNLSSRPELDTNRATLDGAEPRSLPHGIRTNLNQTGRLRHEKREISPLGPATLKQLEHRLMVLEHHIPLERLEFGVLRNHNYSVEYSRSLAEEGGWMTFGYDNQVVRVVLGDAHEDLVVSKVLIYTHSIAYVGLGTEGGSSYMFIVLSQNPKFEGETISARSTESLGRNRGGRWVKHSFLDKNHERVAPYTSRWIRLVFHQNGDRRIIPDIETCRLANIPVTPVLNPPLTFHGFNWYSRSNIEAVLGWLRSGSLDWRVAFQCEALFRNATLTPPELLTLQQVIEELAEEDPQQTCDVLKTFRVDVEGSEARYVPNDFCNKSVLQAFTMHMDNHQRFTSSERLQIGMSKAEFLCYHAKITPTAVHLSGPLIEQSNRVIRKYPGFESYFIIVSFTDEADGTANRFPRERFEKFLKHGIQLGDRHYELLAYSPSGLHNSSCYFSAPFTFNGQKVNAQGIRNGLGNFEKVIHSPALYGSQMGQAFSSTDPSVVLDDSMIGHLPDIQDRTGVRPFTDGCATISKELAEDIWKRMLEQMPQTRQKSREEEPAPCVFQIRVGGSKGVVQVDPRLQGRMLSLRPSMITFDAPGESSLEIARAFANHSPCYLNRSLIALLWSGGVDDSVFITLMKQNLESAIEGTKTCEGVADQFMQNGLGAAFHLDHTFRRLANMGIELDQPGVRNSGVSKILDGVLHHIELSLKYDARIKVPHSYTLVGVCDEHNYLRPNEVYVCVRHFSHRTGKTEFRYLQGRVLVARSPAIHPGDAQVLFAIGKPLPDSPFGGDGNNLPNCVVFSCLGERPVPNMLGGGNLDGDVYNVISYQDLIPLDVCPPAECAATRTKKISTPSTIEDIADFIVDYAYHDVVGMVAANHLAIASRSELRCQDERCRVNAELHFKAANFIKSGYWVNQDKIRQLSREESTNPMNGRRWNPDWRAGRGSDLKDGNFYECPSVLGRLFRSVELTPYASAPHFNITEQDPFGVRNCVARHVAVHKAAIREFMDKFDNDISALRLRYTAELTQICALSSNRVSEVEVMIGTNFEVHSRSKLVERMSRPTRALTDFVRLELKGAENQSPHEWLARAWKAYLLTSQLGDQMFGALSFSWLALESVLDALQALGELILSNEASQATTSTTAERPTATGSAEAGNNHPSNQSDTNNRHSNRGDHRRGWRGSGFVNIGRSRGRPRM